jgi:NAD(P)H dehydrogenase (quinone)
MADICIVYHSGYGHTEVIANAIANGVKSSTCTAVMIKISETGQITPEQWDQLDNAGAIIFGAPTYMGSASGQFKMFADQTSKAWFTLKWKDKIAGGFTNSHSLSGDKLSTLQQMVVLASQHGMIWVSLGVNGADGKNHNRLETDVNRLGSSIGVMAQSENDSPSVTPPSGDIKTAENYGKRIAEVCAKWGVNPR